MQAPFDLDKFIASIESHREETEPPQNRPEHASVGHVQRRCHVDHCKYGFEGKEVYVWRGPYKGKLGSILRTSGALSRVSLESAIRGSSVIDTPSEYLVASVV